MGRPRKDASTGGNPPSMVGATAPASKPATARSTPSSARAKTATTAASSALPTARSAPSTRSDTASSKETVRSMSSQGARKAAMHSYAAPPNVGYGDMNNNQEVGSRSSTSNGGKSKARAVPATKSTPSTASSSHSDTRSHSSRPASAKMPSRDASQGEPVSAPGKGLGKPVEAIEKETRGQRDNPKWHDWRENRITASVAHKIANSKFVNDKSSEVPQSYLKAVVNKSSGLMTPAMSWGVQNEKRAVQEYEHLKSRNPRGSVKVEDCGLFIHPEKNWLAASPDGIIKDQSTGKATGLLEVKCPYKHKDHTIRDACKDNKFCLTPAGDSYALKKDHPYYTQVQTQLAATGLKNADFVVYTNKETAIAPVEFDAKFWKETEPKLEKFYSEAVIPHLQKRDNPVWATEE